MTTASTLTARRIMLNKVPEVTIYFWIIKILCTTVGESFADYINETLGFGLTKTTLLFSAGLIIALVAQFRLNRYVPGIYWLAVVLISVVGTLLTDNLTDGHGVPLWISSTVFAVLLATTVGETAADYLNETLGFGLTWTTVVMTVMTVVLLLVQFRTRAYVAPVY